MNIQDYRILTGWANAYIARLSKNGITMLEPRRVITEEEILKLIIWWLHKQLNDTNVDSQFITKDGEVIIEIKRLKRYDI